MLHHPEVFILVTYNPCKVAHLHFFSRYLHAGKFVLMLGDCYYRLPDRMFILLAVERVSI